MTREQHIVDARDIFDQRLEAARALNEAGFVANSNEGWAAMCEVDKAEEEWRRAENSRPSRDQRIADAALAIQFLESDPDFYQSILVAARLHSPEHTISIVGADAFEAETLAEHKRLITQFMAACWFDPCPRCYQPCVWFMDGRALEWDSLGLHDCVSAPLFLSPPKEQNARIPQHQGRPQMMPPSQRPSQPRTL